MSAAEWAETVKPSAFSNRLDDLDRRALGIAPAYLDTVDRLVRELYDAAVSYRDERRAGAVAADPRLTDAIRPRAWRTVLRVASVFTAAGTLALYFSRADLLPAATIGSAGLLMALTACLLAVTAVPITRRRPPTFGTVVFTGLGALAGVAATVVLIGFDLASSGWFWVVLAAAVLCVVIFVAQLVIRALIGSSSRADLDGALQAEMTHNADVLTQLLAERTTELERAYASLPAPQRSAIEGDLAHAGSTLQRRRILNAADAVTRHTPGMLILDSCAHTASVVMGIEDFPSLARQLTGGTR